MVAEETGSQQPDEDEDVEDEPVEEASENIYHLLRQLPLFDELYLGMQAMNVGLVDLYLMDMERNLWDLYMETERTPVPEATLVSALSQMWVFATYELLRTWRQRVRELIDYGEKLRPVGEAEKKTLIAEKRKRLQELGALVIGGAFIHEHAFELVEGDDDVLKRLKAAWDALEPVFRDIELIRVTLAKHEIPKGRGMLASAPGYGRIGTLTGSITWHVVLKDGSMTMISRRDIADDLRKACRDPANKAAAA